MRYTFRIALASALLIFAVALSTAAQTNVATTAAPRFSGEFWIDLADAMWQESSRQTRSTLQARLFCDGGRWRPLTVGLSRQYNQGDHWGCAYEVALGAEAFSANLDLRIEGDRWIGGATTGRFRLELSRRGDGWDGVWKGGLRGELREGAATGRLVPRLPVEGFVPPTADERPRYLVRAAELPNVRRKTATDWGRKLQARLTPETHYYPSKHALGHAFAFALTGEDRHAARARELILADIMDGQWYLRRRAHGPAHAIGESVLAYDLIHDACPDEFRVRFLSLLEPHLPFLYRGAGISLFNPEDNSNWSVQYRGAVVLAARCLLDERRPPPRPPAPAAIPKVVPPPGYAPDARLPVVKADGGCLGNWLIAGPYPATADPAAVHGLARPAGESFRALAPEHVKPVDAKQPGRGQIVEIGAATGGAFFQGFDLAAVLNVAEAGVYRVELGGPSLAARLSIGNHEAEDGARLHLDAGAYPLNLRAVVAPAKDYFGNWLQVSLIPVPAAEAGEWLAERRQVEAIERRLHEDSLERHKSTGFGDWRIERQLAVAALRVARYVEKSFGEQGWSSEGEGYTQYVLRLLLPVAQVWRNACGRDLVDANLDMTLVNYATRTVFGDSNACLLTYGPGGGPPGPEVYARGFGLTPTAQRPAVLWAWNRTMALSEAGRLSAPERVQADLDPAAAAWTFANYPTEMAERDPDDLLPRAVQDRFKGGVAMRNRWQDGDDCVVTTFADAHPGGWATAECGDLRIQGLGADWAVRGGGWGHAGSSRSAGRVGHSVVIFPQAPRKPGPQSGGILHWQPQQDGSGSVTIGLDRTHGPHKEAPDRPVTGRRAVAVDYSGGAGVPALIAVADRLDDLAGPATWQFVTETAHTVTVEEGAFVIAATNGATLRGTVIAPTQARIVAGQHTAKHENNYWGDHSESDYRRKLLTCEGAGDFLVIFTLQRGPAPAVERLADGEIRVGAQSIAWDGHRLTVKPTVSAATASGANP